MKIVIALLIISVIGALGVAMFGVVNNKGEPEKTVKALTLRVVLSITLFGFLLIAYKLGWLHPHQV